MKIELDMGMTLEPSVQEDIEYTEANYREGDRMSHESLGGTPTRLETFEQCWTVRHDGDVLGYCGVAIPDGTTVLGPERFLCYMSTTHVDRIKVTYVKMSRRIMQAIVARARPWVDVLLSLPHAKYRGSVIWHERVLKMHPLQEVHFMGEDFILFKTTRSEVLGWKHLQ